MKSGFTLVELLAVIVILAVLALIATPVVLSIIDDTKESAMLRSAEMYLSGVENAVMRENMNTGGNFRPNDCTISNGTLSCNSTIVEVEVNGEVPKEGSIVFENGKIKEIELIYESGTIIKDSTGNLVYESTQNKSICTFANDSKVASGEYGAKYNCKVDPNKPEYTFYLIDNNEDGTYDLIMNANINASGEPIISNDANDKGLIEWMSDKDYGCNENYCAKNDKGPITAMNYLYNATKDWTNVSNIIMNYTDEGNELCMDVNGCVSYGYGGIKTEGNITKIFMKDGTFVTVLENQEGYLNLKARLPFISEITPYESDNINGFLYNYMNNSFIQEYYQTNLVNIVDILGTHMLASDGAMDNMHYFYDSINGAGGAGYQVSDKSLGIRPVITVKL